MTRTPAEAKLVVHELLSEILVSLAVDDETSDEEVAELEEDMGDVANVVLDALGFEIVSVDNEDGTVFTARIEIVEGDPLDVLEEEV